MKKWLFRSKSLLMCDVEKDLSTNCGLEYASRIFLGIKIANTVLVAGESRQAATECSFHQQSIFSLKWLIWATLFNHGTSLEPQCHWNSVVE